MSPQKSESHSSLRSGSTSPPPSSSTADETGRFASRGSKASYPEKDAAAEAWKRDIYNTKANLQTAYLKAHAKLEGRRHRGETVEASDQERLDSLEKTLKEAEAACSNAESGLDQCIELANSRSAVRTSSVNERP
jgi:predicted  nucleic acid-binding Zn-ribbon protein